MVPKDEFRKCMSMFATGVTIVTTLDDDDNVHGMSANSFTSVCLEPPLVLVCVAHNTNTYQFVEQRRRFGINVLSGQQEDIGKYFARRPEDRHGDVAYQYSISSGCRVPALDDVLVFFGCEVVSSHLHGDHTVYIAEVKEMNVGQPKPPLIFYQTQWYSSPEIKG